MGDFDWSKDNQLAAGILFPMALFGFTCNLCVVVFLNSMPSLNNSFGSLTLSQAIVDSVHQLLLAFFLAPTIYFQNKDMYDISHQFGYATLLAYEICCFSHVCISVNRFVAVWAPLVYSKLFSKSNTRLLIITTWVLAFAILTYMLQYLDCDFYLPTGTWIYTFRDNPVCTTVKWYGDFSLNCLSVVIVAVLDISSIARLHCINERHNLDAVSAQKRSRQIVLMYQAALQGILFITELITYFLLSGFARNKWEAYALTTISWCLVNGADGLIVLFLNRDFRRQLKKIIACGQGATSVGSLAHRNDAMLRASTTAASSSAASPGALTRAYSMRLIYPEPDSLTVFGPDNSSYSLMLLVRSDAIQLYKPLYFLVVAIEAILLMAGYALHIRGFVLSWRLRAIHVNFMILTAGMYAVMIAGAIGRLLTIPYEARVIQFAGRIYIADFQDTNSIGLHEMPIPILAILRQASYVHAFLVLWVWAIERSCATIYVTDYEKRSRFHISVILNTVFIPLSYAIAYSAVARICNPFIGTAICLAPTTLCALLLRYLTSYNERRLARITHRIERHPDEYSLSLRVQLRENIWSMKKIEFGVYLLTGGLAVNLVIIFAPVLLLTAPDQYELLQWLTCAGNLSFAVFIFCSSPWLEVAIAMHTGKVPSLIRLFLRKDYFYKEDPAPKKEIDSYFDQLDSQWSYGYSVLRAEKK